jgi:hypothetical protein
MQLCSSHPHLQPSKKLRRKAAAKQVAMFKQHH